MGYDLMNEPWPGSTWQQCANPEGCPVFDAIMAQFIKRTIKAIRNVDTRNLVWYEPNVIFNDGADTKVGDTGDKRAGFSFNDYCLPQGFAQADPTRSCDVFDDLVFQNAEDHATAVGDTLLLSEFGATDDLDTIERMVERADEFMVSWQHWHYCPCDDVGPRRHPGDRARPGGPPEGDNLKNAKLDLLSRAYPQVVAGTPESFDFDSDTGRFDLKYSTVGPAGKTYPTNADTEIFLPERHYPDGYTVVIQGGKVRSASGARRLVIENCSGKHDVTVEVTPGAGPVQQSR